MTAFTTELWAKTLLANLKTAEYGFAARIVNHNFHNAGGTRADAVKVILPTLDAVVTDTTAGYAMPTGYKDAASTTITINLNKPLKYAIGLPWEMQLKTEHDITAGFKMTAEDIVVRLRGAQVNATLDADTNIKVISGTAVAPTAVTKANILDILSKARVQLMKSGAIMEYGTYRFVDTEAQENVSEQALDGTPMENEGEQPVGILGGQTKTALPVCGVDAATYELIINAATEAGELTQNKEFFGHVPVVRGFEIVLDNSFDRTLNDQGTAATNPHHVIYFGTRNLITEAMTDSRSEVIPDQNNYRDILRGYIVYGCAVTQAGCGCKAFVSV